MMFMTYSFDEWLDRLASPQASGVGEEDKARRAYQKIRFKVALTAGLPMFEHLRANLRGVPKDDWNAAFVNYRSASRYECEVAIRA